MVKVKDSGPGIHSDLLSRIFEPFFTTKAIGEGMGRGLSICHNIVRDHGGELTVHSEEGKGTSFLVHLPAQSPEITETA